MSKRRQGQDMRSVCALAGELVEAAAVAKTAPCSPLATLPPARRAQAAIAQQDHCASNRWRRTRRAAVLIIAGQIGAACNGIDDNETCDSAPGAGDGWCDACAITGGESTENEMFMLLGGYYVP